jgi:hypothetical protein
MDRTRASLRRVRAYAILIAACLVYATLPHSKREVAEHRAQHLTTVAIDWVAHRFGGK